MTLEAIEDKAKQGVVYAEMRYCPQLLCTVGEHENDANPLIEENPDEELKPSDVVRIGQANLITDLITESISSDRPALSINNPM